MRPIGRLAIFAYRLGATTGLFGFSSLMSTARENETVRRFSNWRNAYNLSFAVSGAFLVLSILAVANDVTSIPLNTAIAGVFMIGALVSGTTLLRAGEGPVAVGMFMLGAGLTFGFGTVYGVVGPGDYTTQILFSKSVQETTLAKLNLVNAVSVSCVLAGSWPLATLAQNVPQSGSVVSAVKRLMRFRAPLIFASVGVVGLVVATYPIPENLLLRGLVATLSKLPLVVLVMVAAQWRSQSLIIKGITVTLLVLLVALGVLSTSKSNALIPLAAVVGGLWINPHTRRTAVGLAAVSCLGYFAILGPLSNNIRGLQTYQGGTAGLSDSIENLNMGAQALQGGQKSTTSSLLRRFSVAPYQAYLIAQHESGSPGSSLSDFWAAAVPRVLWPDKPSITRFGGELYGSINRTRAVSSQLAPTYSAEAFWNYGWFGVILFSVLIGLEIGWFTRKWLDLATGRRSAVGILIFAVPVALTAFLVETWIAATFIGGFLTLFILITGVDVASTYLSAHARRQTRPISVSST